MTLLAGVFSQGHALHAWGPGLFFLVFALVGVAPVLAGELVADRRRQAEELER